MRSLALLLVLSLAGCAQVERRDAVTFLRGKYNNAFFWRHGDAYRVGAAIHIAHAKEHDVLQRTSLSDASKVDARFDEEMVGRLLDPPHIEPKMALWGPLHRAIRLDSLPRYRLDTHAPRADVRHPLGRRHRVGREGTLD